MDPDPTKQPDWTAQLDQATAGLRDLARLVGAYYRALIDEGLDPQIAVALTIGYQAIVASSSALDEEDDRG